MRSEHCDVFYEVAQKFWCWIGLREPNDLADRWIGRPGCVPKSAKCKAKTADKKGFQFAGLVVDPIMRPEAFEPGTLSRAQSKWNDFSLPGGQLPGRFKRIEKGAQRGLITYAGSFIFADYDLMLINRAGPNGELGWTTNTWQRETFPNVKRALNEGFCVPMIQHGSEFMYKGGVGAAESERVIAFGPGRRHNTWFSSMPKGGH